MIRYLGKFKKIAVILNVFLILSLFSPFINFAIAQQEEQKSKINISAPKIQVFTAPNLNVYKGNLKREGVAGEDKGKEGLKKSVQDFKDSANPKKQYDSIKNSFGNLSGSGSDDIKEQKPQSKASGQGTVDSGKKTSSRVGGNTAAYNWQSSAGDAVVEGHFGFEDIRETNAAVGGALITNKNQFNAGAMWKANGHAEFNKGGTLVDMGGGVHGFVGVRNSNTTTIKSSAGTTTATVTTAAGAEGGATGTFYAGEKGLEASGEIGGRIGAWVDASASHNFEVDGQSVGGISFTGGAGLGLAAGVGGGFALRTDKVGLGFSVALGPLKGGFSFYINPLGIKNVLEKRMPPAVREFAKNTVNFFRAADGKFKEMVKNGAVNLAKNISKTPAFKLIQVGMSTYYLNIKKAAEIAQHVGNSVVKNLGQTGQQVASAAATVAQPAIGFVQRVVNAVTGAANAVRKFLGF